MTRDGLGRALTVLEAAFVRGLYGSTASAPRPSHELAAVMWPGLRPPENTPRSVHAIAARLRNAGLPVRSRRGRGYWLEPLE